jgi:hypothetical protein
LKGGGEMGELIHLKDWRKSMIRNPESWHQSLRRTLSIILNSKFSMFLLWESELTCFYNVTFRPSIGNTGKYPPILREPASEFWKEIWSKIKPLIDNVLARNEDNSSGDQLLPFIEIIKWKISIGLLVIARYIMNWRRYRVFL